MEARRKKSTGEIPPHWPEDPRHDEIAARAYELWLNRGCPEGSPAQDWLQAENELKNQARKQEAPAQEPRRRARHAGSGGA